MGLITNQQYLKKCGKIVKIGGFGVKFMKWHGLGNDFIIIDCRHEDNFITDKTAIAMCDRHTGIGADGLVQVLPAKTETAAAEMRIYNADGTIAEMCGNALRCVALMLAEDSGRMEPLQIDTAVGTLKTVFSFDPNQSSTLITVNMGVPGLRRSDIGIDEDGDQPAENIILEVAGKPLIFTGISMGNPHVVTFLSDVECIPLECWGAEVEMMPVFTRQTNVEFVEVGPEGLRMRVWERGVGVTKACGTGACAAMVAAVQNGFIQNQAEVILDGGSLWIEWNGEDTPVYMTGTAVHVYNGVVE